MIWAHKSTSAVCMNNEMHAKQMHGHCCQAVSITETSKPSNSDYTLNIVLCMRHLVCMHSCMVIDASHVENIEISITLVHSDL